MRVWLLGARLALADPGLEAYDQGDLLAARDAWATDQELARAETAYNLGNVWFRLEEPAQAVAWYRRALTRLPRQADVQHNLAVARAALPSPLPPAESKASWLGLLTVGEWASLATLCGGLGSVGLLVGLWRRTALRTAALLWSAGALAGVLAAVGAWEELAHPIVVVVEADLPSRDLPDPQAKPSGSWPAGAELWVVHRAEGYWLVEDGRGRRGWVSSRGVLPSSP